MKSLFIALALVFAPMPALAAPSAHVVEISKTMCPLLLKYPTIPAEIKIEALVKTLQQHGVSETDQVEVLRLCTEYVKYRTKMLDLKNSI